MHRCARRNWKMCNISVLMFTRLICFLSTWWVFPSRCSDCGPSWEWWLRWGNKFSPTFFFFKFLHWGCTDTRIHLWPFKPFRFPWLGLWVVSWMGITATRLCGSHSSLDSPLLCWCTSTTTMSFITGALHSPGRTYEFSYTHQPATRLKRRFRGSEGKLMFMKLWQRWHESCDFIFAHQRTNMKWSWIFVCCLVSHCTLVSLQLCDPLYKGKYTVLRFNLLLIGSKVKMYLRLL